jgi:hypothetical protein
MPPDPPHVLLQKAHDDERLLLLASGESTISDEQIGFLAQQAVEKAIKAVLSLRRVSYRRTHDLSELLDLLKQAGIEFPSAMESCILLTPFAAEMRYDYLPPEDAANEPFDRPGTLCLVRATLDWARARID